MDKRMFEAALFDLDGTLIETEGQYTRFWEETCQGLIPNGREFAMLAKGRTLESILTLIPDMAARAEVVRRLDLFEAHMEYPFVPGALDFLADLHRHHVRTAVVTSSNHAKMRSVYARMPHFSEMFDCILTAEDFAASKPAPDCYLLGARRLGCGTNHCVVFEDAPNGLRAGISAGIFTIGMTTSYAPGRIAHICHHTEPDFLALDYERVNALLAGFQEAGTQLA